MQNSKHSIFIEISSVQIEIKSTISLEMKCWSVTVTGESLAENNFYSQLNSSELF